MEQIANPAGLRVLSSLIDLVNNKGEIGKVIAEVESKIDEANAKIAVVGTIKQIDAYSIAASEALSDARAKVQDAKDEAARILEAAGVKVASESEKRSQKAAELSAHKARVAAVEQREANCKAREEEMQKTMDSAKGTLKKAKRIMGEAETLAAEAERQLAVFRDAAASLN